MVDIQKKIQGALDNLDLPPLVTKVDIKKRYRQLAREHHPDLSFVKQSDIKECTLSKKKNNKEMESINQAYELLMEYIESFRYTFDSKEISRQYPGAEHAKKFKP